MVERSGIVTFQGNPLTLVGPEIGIGDTAPDFEVLANDLTPVTLKDSAGKIRLISAVPSLDTGVCDAQTRRFNEEVGRFGANVIGYTISADLPFAQARWCGAAGIDRITTLSDHKTMSFGQAYGVWIKELRLDSRAVFIIDSDDKVRYVEYVPEVTHHPDYSAALEALTKVAG